MKRREILCVPRIINPLPSTPAPTLRPPRYNNPFGSASAVVTSQEWKEVGLPEIEYNMHNKVTSWHMFYGDVKVRRRGGRAACVCVGGGVHVGGCVCVFVLGVTLRAVPVAAAFEKDRHEDKSGCNVRQVAALVNSDPIYVPPRLLGRVKCGGGVKVARILNTNPCPS